MVAEKLIPLRKDRDLDDRSTNCKTKVQQSNKASYFMYSWKKDMLFENYYYPFLVSDRPVHVNETVMKGYEKPLVYIETELDVLLDYSFQLILDEDELITE